MRLVNMFRAASLALALLAPSFAAHAQTVTALPKFVAPGALLDAGNGPLEFRMLTGQMGVNTSSSSGVGSTIGSATALNLTATPTTVPCVGCIISGGTIVSGTTVISYNGGLIIGMSAAANVASSTTVSWGAACPAAPPTGAIALVQAGVGADMPFYTQARICTYGIQGPGGQYLPFAIGAH